MTATTKPTEKELDRAIEDKFKEESQVFTRWVLERTKFRGIDARFSWSRSNNPWGSVKLPVINPQTGATEFVVKEGETDVLVVFQTTSLKKIALHIENKLLSGRFTPFQPELYQARAKKWQGNAKYGDYEDWETVLIAPQQFFERFSEDAAKFDRFISHEEIALHIPSFGWGG